jgi:hypothetical protein
MLTSLLTISFCETPIPYLTPELSLQREIEIKYFLLNLGEKRHSYSLKLDIGWGITRTDSLQTTDSTLCDMSVSTDKN